MPDYSFDTDGPLDLYLEFGRGHATVTCTETDTETETGTATVHVEGQYADDVVVRLAGPHALHVVEPRRGSFFRDTTLRIAVTVPAGSSLATKLGSAEVAVTGPVSHARLRTGSGRVRLEQASGDVVAETGSGDISVGDVGGATRLKSGSGDLAVGTAGGPLRASTGSGSVVVDESHREASAKTGSGDLRVVSARGSVSLSTGSGDCTVDRIDRGQVLVKGASGSVRIGVPAGVPVWTDISTVTGSIRSELAGAGQPVEGQDHVEVRAKTATGDVVLVEAR
jgi:DUF4097 and DUF4098 domain-containing protein YvlB